MDYNSFYFVNNNDDLVIQASIFRKMKDYTKLLEHIIAVNNKCIELKNNKNLEPRFNIIVYLNDVNIKNIDFDFIKILIPFLEEGYPNNLQKMYFLNIPFIFKSAYNMLKIFIHKDTRKKIVFVKKKNSKKMEKNIDIYSKTNLEEYNEDSLEDLF